MPKYLKRENRKWGKKQKQKNKWELQRARFDGMRQKVEKFGFELNEY